MKCCILGSCLHLREVNRGTEASSAVRQTLYYSVKLNTAMRQKARPSVYRSFYVLTFTYSHKLQIKTNRTRSRIEGAKMNFLSRLAGVSLRPGAHCMVFEVL